VAAAANLDSPAAQVAAAAAALDGNFGAGSMAALPASSSAATMEMIVETHGALMAEGEASAELVAAAAVQA
jgi:hypothetical protein